MQGTTNSYLDYYNSSSLTFNLQSSFLAHCISKIPLENRTNRKLIDIDTHTHTQRDTHTHTYKYIYIYIYIYIYREREREREREIYKKREKIIIRN